MKFGTICFAIAFVHFASCARDRDRDRERPRFRDRGERPALPDVITIAGMFTEEEQELEQVFRFAVQRVNEDKNILPQASLICQQSILN